ncbi:MAG TPA: hypothetical protein VFU69_19825 [Ktedonobacterales bacterium]|nr:hypothetical protein [Ktedonobacterales bacterium]
MMHSESFQNFSRPDRFDAPHDVRQQPPQMQRTGPLQRLWNAWLWLTGPRPERFSGGISGREALRRSRLISALLVLIVLAIPTLVPSALVQPLIWRPLVLLAIGAVLVGLLNRGGMVTISGFAYIVLIDAAIAGYVATKPTFTYGNIPNLDLFILTILIAGMVLPRQLIPGVAALQLGLIVALFNLKPHDIYLQAGIRTYFNNQPYTAIVNALLLQITGAGIAWLHAWSVNRAILRADRAEELAAARARINEQASQIAQQKQRLEQGISALQEVQARVANGEYGARISLQGNELLPLAVSFNLMAERLGRIERLEQDYRRLESAIQQMMEACDRVARGIAPAALRATGTVVDRVFPFLLRLHHVSTQLLQGSALAEDLRALLQHQVEHLTLAQTPLLGSLALVKDLASELGQTLPPVRDERSSGSLGTRGTSEAQAAIAHMRHLLDQHITLLEQVKQYDEYARELGTRCMQGARLLSQRLKEAG